MLARGSIPAGPYVYEVKWDGFRAIGSTVDRLRIRSWRGWDMTALLPELESVLPRFVLDGEVVALDRRPAELPGRRVDDRGTRQTRSSGPASAPLRSDLRQPRPSRLVARPLQGIPALLTEWEPRDD